MKHTTLEFCQARKSEDSAVNLHLPGKKKKKTNINVFELYKWRFADQMCTLTN